MSQKSQASLSIQYIGSMLLGEQESIYLDYTRSILHSCRACTTATSSSSPDQCQADIRICSRHPFSPVVERTLVFRGSTTDGSLPRCVSTQAMGYPESTDCSVQSLLCKGCSIYPSSSRTDGALPSGLKVSLLSLIGASRRLYCERKQPHGLHDVDRRYSRCCELEQAYFLQAFRHPAQRESQIRKISIAVCKRLRGTLGTVA